MSVLLTCQTRRSTPPPTTANSHLSFGLFPPYEFLTFSDSEPPIAENHFGPRVADKWGLLSNGSPENNLNLFLGLSHSFSFQGFAYEWELLRNGCLPENFKRLLINGGLLIVGGCLQMAGGFF